MFTVAKACEFELAHVVETHEVQENAEPHPHQYRLYAEVTGDIRITDDDPEFGMILDFGHLQAILDTQIVGMLNGRTLRTGDLGLDPGWVPTAESICYWSWLRIRDALFVEAPRVRLVKVELHILGAGDTDVDHTGRVFGEHAEPEHWSIVTYSEEADEAAALSLRGQRARSA